MSRRLVLAAVAWSLALTLGASSASAVDGDVSGFEAVAAASLMLERPADGARADGTIAVSRQDGVVRAQIRVCDQASGCTVIFDGVASEAEVTEVGAADLRVRGPIPAFGDLDLLFRGDGPVNKDGCVDPAARFGYTAAGAEVFSAYDVAGAFGSWQVRQDFCGSWGRQAALATATF